MFQSHAGSIEAAIVRILIASFLPCFNPTLVRLRPGLDELQDAVEHQRFNPTLVRLRPHLRRDDLRQSAQVSIPRWFD